MNSWEKIARDLYAVMLEYKFNSDDAMTACVKAELAMEDLKTKGESDEKAKATYIGSEARKLEKGKAKDKGGGTY